MKGAMPEEGVNPVEFPGVLEQFWKWFVILNRKRPPAMAGMAPIPESEIGWFFHNRMIDLAGWELDAIAALDVVAIESSTAET